MKKYIKLIAFAAIGGFISTSCSDEFLEREPTEFISSQQIEEASALNPTIQSYNVAGLYATMYQVETGGTDGHDDFGQKGYDIYSDMLSGDMVLGALRYGWYRDIAQFTTTTDYTFTDNYQVWRYYYRIIFGANNVIEGLGGNDAVLETEEAKFYMGQAKAMRAYSYFYLANFFSTDYDPAEEILPIYTDTKVPNQAKSTTEAVYSLIVSDLEDAITLLEGFERSSKSEVDQSVAKGLLAYAYAAMGNNAGVKTITSEIITTNEYPITDSTQVLGGFNDVATPSWMWGVDLTLDNGLDLVSWWGQVDIFTYSYAWVGDVKSIDDGLFDAIQETDIRKQQFVDAYEMEQRVPINKFYAPERTIGGQRNVTTDYIYMRVDEMYLLNAEASAKTGDEAGAIESLKMLLDQRMPDTSYLDALSGQALLDEIYLQTKIELWGEGKSYLAMKRNKATITRGANHLSDAGVSIMYNDDRLTFEIPQAEIQNNPLIDR